MSGTGTSPAVEFRGVTKRYGMVTAVHTVSFSIARGSLVTLLGPSGCGKTTVLRLIAGLEQASDGRILIDGDDVTLLSAAERDVSMVFQSYALFPHMTVLENVCYGLRASGMRKAQAVELAQAKLSLVGLAGYGTRLPSELSGGQQQRVAVARAIVLEPKVLLFDEPLSNLDAKLRRHVREEIRELPMPWSTWTTRSPGVRRSRTSRGTTRRRALGRRTRTAPNSSRSVTRTSPSGPQAKPPLRLRPMRVRVPG